MKKILLSLVVVCSLLAPVLFSSPAAACPTKEPETLLSLYKASDSIYIGRYSDTETGPVTQDEEHYSVTELKLNFHITSALKGQPAKALSLFGENYTYKDVDPDPEAVGEASETTEGQPDQYTLKAGDDVLLFLRTDEEDKRSVLTDYADGLKKLPVEDIAVYEDRIKDLSAIFAAEQPDDENIVEWLVRCAEERATRWEGVTELQRSFEALEYSERRAAERKEAADNGEAEDEAEEFSLDGYGGTSDAYARLLNDHQQQRLANILLNSEFQTVPQSPERAKLERGDNELIKLIARWADTRVMELFISRVRGGAYTPSETSDLMEAIASMLNDKKIEAIAEAFSDASYREENAVVDEEDILEPDEAEPESEATVAEPEAAPQGDAVTSETGSDVSEPGSEAKPELTYGQYRTDLIARFLARADALLADPQLRVSTK